MSGPEVLTPVQARMATRLGQGGAAGWRHRPRGVVELEPVAVPSALLLLGPAPLSPGDGAPATVAMLVRRTGGTADYVAGLYPDGPTTVKGPASAEGDSSRVPAPALDRWVLIEWITVRWSGEAGTRGFALWKRSGRGRWRSCVAWWRDAYGGWSYGKPGDVPSTV